jgi:aminoglycoside phosphotransferase (APT) family kinase protein
LFLQDTVDVICRCVPADLRTVVSDLVTQTRRAFENELPAGALVHGDYWHGNVLFDHKGNVTGIIDWAWARNRGAPLTDVLHLLSRALAHDARRSPAAALAAIVRGEAEGIWITALQHSLSFHGLSRQHATAAAHLLILRRIWQGYCLTWSGGERWLRTLLRDARIAT